MKIWEQAVVAGIIGILLGSVLIAWGLQAVEPINITQEGREIRAELDPFFILPLCLGTFLAGMGLGSMALAYEIRKLEKSIR